MSHREDPIWLQAQQVFITPPASTADQRLLQSVAAAITMWAVEQGGAA